MFSKLPVGFLYRFFVCAKGQFVIHQHNVSNAPQFLTGEAPDNDNNGT